MLRARERGNLRGDGAMMWGDYIKRTAVRRVVWIVVGVALYALLSAFGIARAQSGPGTYPSRGEAYAACMAWGSNYTAPEGGVWDCWVNESARRYNGGHKQAGGGSGCVWNCSTGGFLWVTACPNGGEWRDDLKRCFDPAECLARNQQEGFGVPTTRGWQSKCVAGCTLSFDPNQGRVCATVNGQLTCSGSLQWTGDQCDLPPGQPPRRATARAWRLSGTADTAKYA